MVETASRLRAAALACLFHHECGGREAVAYRLSFARIGASGASFGRLQADCHADPEARATLGRILKEAGMASDRSATILGWLALRMPQGWIGAPADLRDIDTAIAAPAGRAIVDAQDTALLDGALLQLQHCRQSAARNGSTIADDAALAICLWTNQAGPPTALRLWLSGETVTLGGRDLAPLPRGTAVTLDRLIAAYLQHVPFEARYPAQLAALREAVAAGLQALGPEPPPDGAASPQPAAPAETARPDPVAPAAIDHAA
jgi:hypothetical protein